MWREGGREGEHASAIVCPWLLHHYIFMRNCRDALSVGTSRLSTGVGRAGERASAYCTLPFLNSWSPSPSDATHTECLVTGRCKKRRSLSARPHMRVNVCPITNGQEKNIVLCECNKAGYGSNPGAQLRVIKQLTP